MPRLSDSRLAPHAGRDQAKDAADLRRQVERQSRRMRQAQADRPTLLAHTRFVAMLGLLFALPVVGCAYLGLWLDGLAEGYSFTWTLSLLLLGVVVGAVNIYLFVRD
jgi:ATP synthase protein I